MKPDQLAKHIRKLSPFGPASDALERALGTHAGMTKKWYKSQKQHWLGWLREYDGPGAYNRKTYGGRSAAYAYNHIKCAPMLLWLAEAVSVDDRALRQAKCATVAAGKNLSKQCGALRVIIPWEMISECLLKSRIRNRAMSKQ